ncbi:toxin-activating lysine-acyltransferase [Roseovarius sp. ZX-A-9]|uniref:toxin-activating lysine-acyltransferase n=1 Tax=Roseovarius sp. ZX-A-9 TaxID=3014783 RepID=UPI00232D6CB2|nr:toxin-activating lysine-acyltransferase [Roseovarius sp. ZX-A-9]
MTKKDATIETSRDAPQNGQASEETQPQSQQIDPEVAAKLANLRSSLRENFGKAVMAMMMVPRYRSQNLADLQHLVLDPMLQDRLAFAYPGKSEKQPMTEMAGFAIWASVSEEVDKRIREQLAAGVFPIRLKTEDWNSGNINWLLDVIAPDQKTITSVIANFRQVIKDGELRLHPLISRMVDAETLEKMGARRDGAKEQGSSEA